MRIQRLMQLHRLYREAAGEHGSDEGGAGATKPGTTPAAGAEGGDGGEGSTVKAAAGGEGGGEGGKPKPTDAEAALLKDVMKHKGRAETLSTEVQALKDQVKAFEGIDPVKVRALLAQQQEAEVKEAEARGDYERLKAQMAAAHAAEKTAMQTQLDLERSTSTNLQRQIADLTVGGSFSGSVLVKDELTLTPAKARVIYGAHFEYKDGTVIGYSKPAGASDRAPLVNAAGEPLSFDEALRKIVDADPDKDQLYRSKVRPGAGSSTTAAKPGAAATTDTTGLTGSARIAAALKAKSLAN